MRICSSRHGLFAVAALTLGGLAVTSPALAVGGPFNCSTHARMTTSSKTITGNGSMSCDGVISGLAPRKLTVKVQRSRFFGWETVSTTSRGYEVPPLYFNLYTTYTCAGTGTHDFRTSADGQILAAWPNANETTAAKRVSCARN